MNSSALRDVLEEKYIKFNTTDFIPLDPISIPHAFSKQEDIEISGFLVASIAWGQRVTILRNARLLMQHMENQPYDFVMNAGGDDLRRLTGFVHRTFNGDDCLFFVEALKHLYLNCGGMEKAFSSGLKGENSNIADAIASFRNLFLQAPHLLRSRKHLANPATGSAAKRINMFLRWMVRNDDKGVDFGLWKHISPAQLYCPLDVHVGNVARRLGLLSRTQNDWRAVEELTVNLRKFDAEDPVKYDFALFGMGVFKGEMI
ncbi:MAG: TIGR02757 family protein [Lentimicrobium sp.]|jgi:uncharacterized protein (TIGR02757 family)|nr:TIGR02757 family protein [Lentimicrobium sp.]